jgi:hypothetical protein
MRAAILVLLVAALGVSVSGSSAAPTWNSNTFRSPDGQVKCRYFADDNAITCYTGHYGSRICIPVRTTRSSRRCLSSVPVYRSRHVPPSSATGKWSTDGRRKTIACTATRRSPAIVGPGITCRGWWAPSPITASGFRPGVTVSGEVCPCSEVRLENEDSLACESRAIISSGSLGRTGGCCGPQVDHCQ